MRLQLLRAAAMAALMATPVLVVSTNPAPAYARGAPDSFADLATQLSPSVVNVSSTQKVEAHADRGPEMPGFPPGSPFEQFFRDFMERNHPGGGGGGGQAPGQRRGDAKPPSGGNGGGGGDNDAPPGGGGGRAVSLGSGFIIDSAGYIVTNNHVIDGADEISVTLTDNTTLKAKLVGKDDRVDLALLKVTTDHPLTAVKFGDSDGSRVGDWVLAIGNPFGLGGSVTAGIVSARGRDIRQGPYDDFIQTDAAINRGNSGGPLFNMNGDVIGINTAIYSPSGGSVGIGFSIPSNLAKGVVMQLREYGKARRGWLGVRIQQVTPDIAEAVGLKDAEGAMVAGMNDGGPAEKAGIHNGDVILKFNGQDVKEMRALPRIVAETDIGKSVPVIVWRDHKNVTLQASPGELPDDIQQASATSTKPDAKSRSSATMLSGLGAKLSPITDALREQYKLTPDQTGVVITDVQGDGPAAGRGLKPGDVIVEVQQEPVSTPQDIQDRLEKYRKQNRKTVLMLVQNGDGMRWIPLPLNPSTDKQPG